MSIEGSQSKAYDFFLFLTVNGGYNHCNLISEKKNMMDMEMTSSSVPVCRQGLFIHTGNPLMRDHPLSCERLLHVGQLNLTHSDIRYHWKFYWLRYFALLEWFIAGTISQQHPWVLHLEEYFWLLLHLGSPLDARLTALLIYRFALRGHAHVHRQLSKAVPGGVTVNAAAAPCFEV